ncbi:MAG: C40 family peptidase [Clostridia bacterium]|nr:C40 family peptidase [Clostridia bacterium]
MKKFLTMFLCAVMAVSFACPYISAVEAPTYSNYDIIKEVAYAYDRQGAQILYDQLNARRHIYASPEDATAQRTVYLDCSSYVNSCYREAFGVNVMPVDISSGVSGTSPSTVNLTKYAKENPDNVDVVGYWENADYTTEEAKQEIMNHVRSQLEIGDLLVYRHGKTSDSSGHVYIYVGNNTFMHCYGGGSYTRNASNPALSYDGTIGEETNGMIDDISCKSIFEDTSNKRYLFKETSSDTVRNFCLLRPLARGLTPTEKTLKRMEIAGLSMEKTASVYENSAVYTGDVITYTITLENTASTAYASINVTDVIPEGTELVSATDATVQDGKALSWSIDAAAKATVKLTYDVRVTESTPGALIKSESTYVNGIELGDITHSVSGYAKAQGLILGEIAREHIEKATAFDSGLSFANALYKSALGIDLFGDMTEKDALDSLIDVENRDRYTDTELSKMIAPNLYGGYSIRYGWLYNPSQNSRTRLISEDELEEGDIIIADYSGGSIVYVYIGNSTLATVKNGVCTTLTIGKNIHGEGADNILISLLGYDRFAVLRPSMTNTGSDVSVESIAVTTPPAKLTYKSGETFDSTGMVVSANMSDGSIWNIKGYSVTPEILEYPTNSVTVSFGGFTASLEVTVLEQMIVTSVKDAVLLDVDREIMAEGIVVGASNEGDGTVAQKELLIKDISSDHLIAVRGIPSSYGAYPFYGYEKGDRITFKATVKTDAHYTEKKYLAFSSENGEKDTTIISKNNEITYNFDNAVTLSNWTNMKKFYRSTYSPYTYFKITGGVYMNQYTGSSDGVISYRVHKNSAAAKTSDMKVSAGTYLSLRDNIMKYNVGEDWTKLFFDEASSSVPGVFVDKEFYAVYIGGNNSYFQLVILDEDWIENKEFAITKIGADKKSAQINVPTAGSYSVVFADYDKGQLKNVDIVPVTVSESQTGKVTVNMQKSFTLEADDKVMLWSSMTDITPMCEEFKVK